MLITYNGSVVGYGMEKIFILYEITIAHGMRSGR
jgi:hypothetical protein